MRGGRERVCSGDILVRVALTVTVGIHLAIINTNEKTGCERFFEIGNAIGIGVDGDSADAIVACICDVQVAVGVNTDG